MVLSQGNLPMTRSSMLMQNREEAGVPAVVVAPEDQMAQEDLTTTGTTRKRKNMEDPGDEDVNVGGGIRDAQMGEVMAMVLMDQGALLMADHAPPPGEGARPLPTGTRFPRNSSSIHFPLLHLFRTG